MMHLMDVVPCMLGRLPVPTAPSRTSLLRLLVPLRSRTSPTFSHKKHAAFCSAAAAADDLGQRQHAPAHAAPAAEDFYAGNNVTFSSLGLSPEICDALQQAGFHRPAHAQELAVPRILQGQDVVLAAETGSGKTLAYLAPLINLALMRRQQAAAAAAAAAAAGNAGTLHPEQQQVPQQRRWRRHEGPSTAALVLCPNAALCEQVVAAAQGLRDPASGAPLARAAFVSSQNPPPLALPDIVVTTPGALLSLMDNAGPAYGFEWTRAGLPVWAGAVVFDEADLLLSGGYGAQMRVIWDALRAGDRLHLARRICLQVGLSEDEFAELPRHLKQAAKLGGAQGLLDAGLKPRRGPSGRSSSSGDGSRAASGQQQQQAQQEEEQQEQQWWSPEDAAHEAAAAAAGVHGPSWRRQYVFVAATMPAEGERSVGAELVARFPEAAWLAGRQLHQSKRSVEHGWREVEDGEHRVTVLREVLASDEQLQRGEGRMLVFARDVASAEATAAALEEGRGSGGGGGALAAGRHLPPVLRYHKAVPAAERAEALARMSSEQGLVMVCTDAAARGLDVPDITHVVQADFATSAIDFLHRVGRTARAGKAGQVTSLYLPDNRPLVEAIKHNIAKGQPVEGAFSRKRSFRKKMKKYGEYVPRGQEGPAEPRQQRKAELAARAEQRRRWR